MQGNQIGRWLDDELNAAEHSPTFRLGVLQEDDLAPRHQRAILSKPEQELIAVSPSAVRLGKRRIPLYS